MKKHLFIALLFMTGTLCAQEYGQSLSLTIWDNASAPHSNGIVTPERDEAPNRPADISEARLFLFPAERTEATGQAVVICPGGGYHRLAMDHEGYMLAQWFAAHGITAAILKYRMPNGHCEVPLEDAVEALRLMRARAGEYGFDPAQVGIAGSSAGGHLAAYASTCAPQGETPAFAILFYPVITGEEGKCHKGSFDNLLGRERTPGQTRFYSLENRVTETAPPTLLLLSDDDRTVPPVSSTRYYDALKACGVEASMHIFPSGGHGWGARDDFRYKAQWQALALDWLERQRR